MNEKKNDQKNESFEGDKVFRKSNLPWRTSQINKIILLNRFFHYRHKEKNEMRLDLQFYVFVLTGYIISIPVYLAELLTGKKKNS